MGFNKGEWSELYTFLYLLLNPHLAIVDEKLKVIENNQFQIVKIISSDNRYKIKDDMVIKISNNGLTKEYNLSYISNQNRLLLEKISTHQKSRGSFEIEGITPLVDDLFDGKKPKGSSSVKGDLEAIVLDKNLKRAININYSIKSNLGRPATLLNASTHTNFIYQVTNIDDDIMKQNNAINGRKKLLNRCKFLSKNHASVKFVSVESATFDYNLKMIDSNLDRLLANILYLSYEKNQKDIKKLISNIIKDKDKYNFYQKKIGDFANAVAFGMMASKKWNGINEVNGGILLVSKSGEVYLLDLIYFKAVVDKYLIDNIKLESPSSTRYKMFEIYKESEKYYFKLNLQIRFK